MKQNVLVRIVLHCPTLPLLLHLSLSLSSVAPSHDASEPKLLAMSLCDIVCVAVAVAGLVDCTPPLAPSSLSYWNCHHLTTETNACYTMQNTQNRGINLFQDIRILYHGPVGSIAHQY